MLPKAMLIYQWTQYEIALPQFRIHLFLLPHSIFKAFEEASDERDLRSSDAISPSPDLSLSEEKAAHAAGSLFSNSHCGRAHM